MPEKKTVNVEEVMAPMNRALAAPSPQCVKGMSADEAYRMGIATALETVLQHARRYRGFSYLDVDHSVYPPHIPDDSRRQYI